METFFDGLDSMQRFTMNLDYQRDSLQCRGCGHGDHLVSHGFVYDACRIQVGKRLLCSKRYGRDGCGLTTRLYLKDRIPGLHYSAACVTVFVMTLIAGLSIQQAYFNATDCDEVRNGFRWLDRLTGKLAYYCGRLIRPCEEAVNRFCHRVHRLNVLLSSLTQCFDTYPLNGAASYQLAFQERFM